MVSPALPGASTTSLTRFDAKYAAAPTRRSQGWRSPPPKCWAAGAARRRAWRLEHSTSRASGVHCVACGRPCRECGLCPLALAAGAAPTDGARRRARATQSSSRLRTAQHILVDGGPGGAVLRGSARNCLARPLDRCRRADPSTGRPHVRAIDVLALRRPPAAGGAGVQPSPGYKALSTAAVSPRDCASRRSTKGLSYRPGRLATRRDRRPGDEGVPANSTTRGL